MVGVGETVCLIAKSLEKSGSRVVFGEVDRISFARDENSFLSSFSSSEPVFGDAAECSIYA